VTRCAGCFTFSDSTPDIGRYGLGVAAMAYQNRGYAVLPLVRGGKKPHRMLPREGGVHHASHSQLHSASWWAGDPAANVGVATGSTSRLAVIDMDVKGAHNGPLEFARFAAQGRGGLPLPAGPWVRTPSGGCHFWLRTPEGVAVPERPGILPGVDVKGDGGLVVAPPSMALRGVPGPEGHSEPVPVPYSWAGCPCSVPAAPGWLLPWLASAPSLGTAAPTPAGDGGGELDLAQLEASGIPRGQRNSTLYRAACKLSRLHGTSPSGSARVIERVRAIWEAGDRADLPWTEVLVTVESARRWVAKQERDELIAANRFLSQQ
jgi:putative DNA primase/helicase